jgi:hypothetical protein
LIERTCKRGAWHSSRAMETRARARAEREAAEQEEHDLGYVNVVLTDQEKELVQSIQRRDLAARSQIDWKEAAESVGLREEYPKALCLLPMPLFSNNVPQKNITKALWCLSIEPQIEERRQQVQLMDDQIERGG